MIFAFLVFSVFFIDLLSPGTLPDKICHYLFDEEVWVLFLQSSDILKFVSTPVSLRCISFQENY